MTAAGFDGFMSRSIDSTPALNLDSPVPFNNALPFDRTQVTGSLGDIFKIGQSQLGNKTSSLEIHEGALAVFDTNENPIIIKGSPILKTFTGTLNGYDANLFTVPPPSASMNFSHTLNFVPRTDALITDNIWSPNIGRVWRSNLQVRLATRVSLGVVDIRQTAGDVTIEFIANSGSVSTGVMINFQLFLLSPY